MARTKRAERIPVSGPRNILTVADKDPNYEYRWVNDDPGRIERFKLGGWEVVTDNLVVGDAAVDRSSQLGSAIVKSVGGKLTAVLMRIPREWYDEDQAAKQADIDALEATMKQPAAGDYGSVVIKKELKK